ncbi:alpha/beta fold hydrolase [Olivibacter sitiensis]|uniref:alpha/beta fold hydrolase n=1 Tax=Olivibacter sitiensis TaxID=376470 RepID=UPI0004299C2E|nr:alpha/beta hydrolase [Olivibacter sitiensis]
MKKLLLLLSLCFIFTALTAQQKTFVLVHGAWGGGWSFKKVDSLLSAQGHQVYRPTLTGLGERVHLASPQIDLSTHIKDVVNTILYERLHNVVLVGHSYGGMVITGVADSIPERIGQLIYLDAFLPEDGESVVQNEKGAPNIGLEKMVQDGMVVPFWVPADKPLPKDVPQSVLTFTQPIQLRRTELTSKIPSTYILTVDEGKQEADDDFYFFYQRAKQKNWKTWVMTADHNPQWYLPEDLVNYLIK